MSLHSTRIIEAIITGLTASLTGFQVAEEENRPADIGEGLVIVRRGEPGDPEVMLSPVAYSYDHAIPLEIVAATRAEVDAALASIREWLASDRSLGGLCDWLDAEAPVTDLAAEFGSENYPYALLDLVASYTIPTPLS